MTNIRFIIIGLGLSLISSGTIAAVVAVVSATNPVTTLSKNQVMDIFLAKTSRFPDGSKAMPIDQVEGSAVRNEFYATFADKSAAQIKAHWSKIVFTGRGRPPREVSSSSDLRKIIAENPNAIGYIESSMVDSSVKIVVTP